MLIVLALIGVWAGIFFHDGPLPIDGDLRERERPELAPEENSALIWPRLREEGLFRNRSHGWRELPWSEKERGEFYRQPENFRNREAVRQWIEAYKAPLSRLRSALVVPGFSITPELKSLPPSQGLRALCTHAWYSMVEEDPVEAWEWLQAAKEWQRRFLVGESQSIQSLIIVTNSDYASAAEAFIAAQLPSEEPTLLKALQEVRREPIPVGWEKRFLHQQYAKLTQKLSEKWYFGASLKRSPPEWAEDLFRPHRTQRKLADWTRLAIDQLGDPELNEEVFDALRKEPSGLQQAMEFATGNAGGEWILRRGFFLPSEYLLGFLERMRTDSRLAQLVVALRLYEVRRGALPDRLDALVPQILPEIPRDPFAPEGQPFQYDPARGQLSAANGTTVTISPNAPRPATPPSPPGS